MEQQSQQNNEGFKLQYRQFGFTFFNREPPTKEMITKRRRLSESFSTGEKQLNESFIKMEINGNSSYNSKNSISSDNEKIQSIPYYPLPIRIIQPQINQNKLKTNIDVKFNNEFLILKSNEATHSINNHLFLEQLGIKKYLTLDCDQKVSDLMAQQKIMENNHNIKIASQSQKFYYPYGVPANFDFLMKQGEKILKDNMIIESQKHQEQSERDKFIQNMDMNRLPRITKEERSKKVELYLLKKQNRQWRAIRYETRKCLAQQRDRVQGRFVKSDKPRFQWLSSQEDKVSMSQSALSSGSYQDKKQVKDIRKSQEVIKNSTQFSD